MGMPGMPGLPGPRGPNVSIFSLLLLVTTRNISEMKNLDTLYFLIVFKLTGETCQGLLKYSPSFCVLTLFLLFLE